MFRDEKGQSAQAARNSSNERALWTVSIPLMGRASSHMALSESASPSGPSATTGPRGVTTTRSITSGAPLTRITSSRTSQGTKPSPWRTLRPSSPNSSMNRSVVSTRPAVTPQAATSLCPAGMAGPPMKVAPDAAQPGVRTWARYQGGGRVGRRWGSLDRMGLPVDVLDGARAQLLEPPAYPVASRRAARSSESRSAATPWAAPGGDDTGWSTG